MNGVSLVIPCFNQAGFVSAAISSALAQATPPAEIIVVDDGSTDGSAEQARRFGKAVRLLRQPNRGAAAARNAGVRKARLELIAFLDGDDLWPPRSLAVRLELLRSSASDFVFGGVRQFRDDGRSDFRLAGTVEGRLSGAMLIRRDAFDRVGPFDERLRSAEAIDWAARAAALGLTGSATSEVVLHRRVHGANLMLTDEGSVASRFAVLRANVGRKRSAAAP